MIIGLVIVTVMFILNFVHCEITACDSDNKQSLILSYDAFGVEIWQIRPCYCKHNVYVNVGLQL